MNFSTSRSLLVLAWLTFRRQAHSRKTVVALAILIAISAMVILLDLVHTWEPRSFGQWIVLGLFGGFFVPVVTLAFGTGALGDARDEKSLIHLLVRPLPRAGIYLAKVLGVLPIVMAFSLGGLWFLGELARRISRDDAVQIFSVLWPGILLSTLAYLLLFQFFAAAFRHSTLIALAYVFFIEVFIGRMPGILKRISIQFYASCMAFDSGSAIRLTPGGRAMRIYVPIDGETAQWVLIILTVCLLATGAFLFTRREYRDLS